MGLIFAVIVLTVVVGGISIWQWWVRFSMQMEESRLRQEELQREQNRKNINAPRLLVQVAASTITGWGPTHQVSVPPGEYVAFPTEFQHKLKVGPEKSICFMNVPQRTSSGQPIERDVHVRIADYSFLCGFPRISESENIRVISAN